MSVIRLALAQLNVTVGDLAGNQRLVLRAIRQAQAWLADVVIVPELAISGYPPEDLLLKPQFIEANQKALSAVAAASRGLVALVGFVDRDGAGRLYNAAAVLANGQHVATYRKRCLPNYGVFDEQRYFAAGTAPLLVDIAGVRCGVSICEDLWADTPIRELANAGAAVVMNLAASPYHAGKQAERARLFATRARRYGVAIAYCNLIGGQDELVFDGGSLVLDATGRVQAQGGLFMEDLVVHDLALPPRRRPRVARRGVGRRVTIRHQALARSPIRVRPPEALSPVEEVYEALVLGVRDYVRKNGFSTVVLGLSGGIDSALTAALAADALGADRVVGIIMPSRFSSKETQDDAQQLVENLGIETQGMSIMPIFEAFRQTLQPVFRDRVLDVTEQNLQARIRGMLLMALSNTFGWLVLTTGNKSEIATGYTTLYGDMAGGFAVIKDVPKTLVYRLAYYRNACSERPPIPARILERPPTAELAPNQTDQDTLPPYDVLDRILKAYVEEDQSLREILSHNRMDPALTRKVIQMVDRSEYKRRQGPPGIKITPKAFGKDRRMPITNRYEQS